LDKGYDISKINKQGCGLARKGHGNAINDGNKIVVLTKCAFKFNYNFMKRRDRLNKPPDSKIRQNCSF